MRPERSHRVQGAIDLLLHVQYAAIALHSPTMPVRLLFLAWEKMPTILRVSPCPLSQLELPLSMPLLDTMASAKDFHYPLAGVCTHTVARTYRVMSAIPVLPYSSATCSISSQRKPFHVNGDDDQAYPRHVQRKD